MNEFTLTKGDGLPRKTLLKEGTQEMFAKQSTKKLPKITFSMQEETDDDVSNLTGFNKSTFQTTGPALNNPLLPIHLNRDLSSLTSPIAKKFELPPQVTIAYFDEKEKVVKAAT